MAHAILQFATEHRIGHVVVGRTRRKVSLLDRLFGRQDTLDRLIAAKRDFKIVVAS